MKPLPYASRPRNVSGAQGQRTLLSPLFGLSGVHLILLFLLWWVADVVGERHWLTTLIAYTPPLFYLALLPLLLVLSLWKRDVYALALNGVAVIFGLFEITGLTLGGLLPAPGSSPDRIRVLTYNIRHGETGPTNIARFIRQQKADVVSLQECNAFYAMEDPMPTLQKALPEYRFIQAGDCAIASRFPIRGTRLHPLIVGQSYRIAVEVTLEVPGREGSSPLTVIGVHLATAARPVSLLRRPSSLPSYLQHTAQVRSEQFRRLLLATRSIRGPLIVCGDFNTPPRGVLYHRFRKGNEERGQTFTDAFAERGVGFGWTFPTKAPCLRIDYVFASGGVTVLSARLPNSHLSDHCPLLVEVARTQRRKQQ